MIPIFEFYDTRYRYRIYATGRIKIARGTLQSGRWTTAGNGKRKVGGVVNRVMGIIHLAQALNKRPAIAKLLDQFTHRKKA